MLKINKAIIYSEGIFKIFVPWIILIAQKKWSLFKVDDFTLIILVTLSSFLILIYQAILWTRPNQADIPGQKPKK